MHRTTTTTTTTTTTMVLSVGEDPVILAGFVLPQYQRVTEGQTDGRSPEYG